MTRDYSWFNVMKVALCSVVLSLSFAMLSPALCAEPAQALEKLEFCSQTFSRENIMVRLMTIPLLNDEEFKRFKGLYFEKLGEGMDAMEVDAKMAEAFDEYNRLQDRTKLMERLGPITEVLNSYQPPPYSKEQFVYVSMGASLSQGGGASPPSKGWVYIVADRLRSIYPEARVRNLAVGGKTTQHARDVQLPEAIECYPDLITFTAGLNDLQYGVPAETVRENTDVVLRELTEKTDSKVVITLMPDFYSAPAFSLGIPKLEERKADITSERIDAFNAIFKELGAKYNAELADIGEMFDGSMEDDEVDRHFSFDGVHPNNAGHARFADMFWPTIERVLGITPDRSVEGATSRGGSSIRSVWDIDTIKSMPLDVEVVSETRSEGDGKEYLEREVLYTSQVTDGKPVRALAYLTIPLGANKPLPAMVSIRALWGGPSHKNNSLHYAREYGVVSLGVHLPEGQSRAVWPEGFTEITDHEKDYEKSYFYVLANAAMRGVTYLQTLSEVNPNRIGITGASRGGMASIIANGVDERIRMAIPMIAAGFSPEGLQHLKSTLPMPLLVASTLRFNPLDYALTQHGATFLVVGAQDPVFPYAEASGTFQAFPGEKRFEAVFDWGHGSYVPDSAAETELGENAGKKMLRARLNTKAWIDRWLFDKEPLPASPAVEMKAEGGRCLFTARIDPGSTRTLLVFSTDGAKTFKKVLMKGEGGHRSATVRISAEEQRRMTYYVEVEYGDRCFLSSPPVLAERFEERN